MIRIQLPRLIKKFYIENPTGGKNLVQTQEEDKYLEMPDTMFFDMAFWIAVLAWIFTGSLRGFIFVAILFLFSFVPKIVNQFKLWRKSRNEKNNNKGRNNRL